jgi:chromosome segregation ATPase
MPRLRACHQDVLEAKIRLIETTSDIASLNERNSDITDQVAREEQLVRHVELEARRVKDIAARTRDVCIEIQADPEMEPYIDQFKVEEPGITVALVEREIAAEESRLDFIHATNPNAIRDFEARQKEVERLQEKMEQNESRLRRLEAQITKIRDVWEPALDRLIEKISEAFSFNFEQIGCAGEVSIHKDEDFELWAIQIKVRFR